MIIKLNNKSFVFEKASLEFIERDIISIFKTKNNKTLKDTLNDPKYKSVRRRIKQPTEQELNKPLGEYLIEKKNSNDLDYKLFLNKYGDYAFCNFKLKSHLKDKGLYIWVVGGEIKYLGSCTNSFKERINQGYGKISAKNCFKDGQNTNCRINSKINSIDDIELYVYQMNDKIKKEIKELELALLSSNKYEWNIQNN